MHCINSKDKNFRESVLINPLLISFQCINVIVIENRSAIYGRLSAFSEYLVRAYRGRKCTEK